MYADDAAVAVHQRDLGILDLARARVAAHLAHRFEHVKEPAAEPRVAARKQTAVGGDRQFAAEADASVLDEMSALAFFAEAEVFEFDDEGDGETIVNLRDVDVGRRKTGGAERIAAGIDRAGGRQFGVADVAVAQAVANAPASP